MPLPVLIIGAGPYGVSIALELHRRGVCFVICGEPFSLWRKHTLTAASLRSDIHVSEVFTHDRRYRLDAFMDATLPAAQAQIIRKGRVPVALFRKYLSHVQSRLPFEILEQRITHLAGGPGGYVAETAEGTIIEASQVILACGVEAHQHLPPALTALSRQRVVHGWDVRQYESVCNQRVLIIGSGQSAAEAVWHLSPSNRITWLYRTPPTFHADPIALPRTVFALAMRGSHLFSMFPSWLRRQLHRSLVGATITPDLKPHLEAPDVVRVGGDAEMMGLTDREDAIHCEGLNADFDMVVACTGYRYGLRNLAMLAPPLAAAVRCDRGLPVLSRGFETSAAGLYVVGAMAELKHGPAMRFLSGTRTASLLVGAAVVRRFQSTPHEQRTRSARISLSTLAGR